jgi:hypothetical protein
VTAPEHGSVMNRPEVYRQSLLRGATICMRRTLHGLKVGDDLATGWVEHYGDLGTAWHEFQHRYLKTLGEQGEVQMPTQEAIEVLYEVLPSLPFTLPFEAMDELRGMVLKFCEIKWNPRLLKHAEFETELRAEVACPDGEIRTLKGTPDVLMFDPPYSLLVIDGKSGRGKPRGPRVEPEAGEVVEERKYLSDLFQGDTYSYLGMRRYPSVRRVVFREYHVRSGQVRQGTLSREQLEHVERKLAVVMVQVDRAISEGEDSHCVRQCPVARSCPIPQEMRGDGALASPEDADAAARRWAVLEGERAALRGQLYAWADDPAHRLPLANETHGVGWKPPMGRGRRFGLWPVADLAETTSESEERAA